MPVWEGRFRLNLENQTVRPKVEFFIVEVGHD